MLSQCNPLSLVILYTLVVATLLATTGPHQIPNFLSYLGYATDHSPFRKVQYNLKEEFLAKKKTFKCMPDILYHIHCIAVLVDGLFLTGGHAKTLLILMAEPPS